MSLGSVAVPRAALPGSPAPSQGRVSRTFSKRLVASASTEASADLGSSPSRSASVPRPPRKQSQRQLMWYRRSSSENVEGDGLNG